MTEIAKTFLMFGAILLVIGGLLLLAPNIPFLGRLPSDIYIKKGPVTFYFPLATSIIISILVTLLINLFWKK